MSTITRILKNYGLEVVYRSHTWCSNYPIIRMSGMLHITPLLAKADFLDSAFFLGLPAELWAEETVYFSELPGGTMLIDATDQTLERLMHYHVARAAQDIQSELTELEARLERDPVLQALAAQELAAQPTVLPALNHAPVTLRDLSRAERLDRARALRGERVVEPGDDWLEF